MSGDYLAHTDRRSTVIGLDHDWAFAIDGADQGCWGYFLGVGITYLPGLRPTCIALQGLSTIPNIP